MRENIRVSGGFVIVRKKVLHGREAAMQYAALHAAWLRRRAADSRRVDWFLVVGLTIAVVSIAIVVGNMFF